MIVLTRDVEIVQCYHTTYIIPIQNRIAENVSGVVALGINRDKYGVQREERKVENVGESDNPLGRGLDTLA